MTIDQIIEKALAEDLGDGDHTSLSTISENAKGQAIVKIKQAGVVCGLDVAKKVFLAVDKNLSVTLLKEDGDKVHVGDVILKVWGKAISILSAERLALNFMQRMSGIATTTQEYTSQLQGLSTRLLDTRKTTPLLRELEKYAVKTGGGENHRMGLYDMVMIKDNHIDFAGGIEQAIDRTQVYLAKTKKDLKIEIEVRNLDELKQVIAHGGVHRVMLDNFSPEEIKNSLVLIDGKFETEASGGITFDTIRKYAETGVDFISVGALTHHIKSLDMSLLADFVRDAN